jgi:hypothetical protein
VNVIVLPVDVSRTSLETPYLRKNIRFLVFVRSVRTKYLGKGSDHAYFSRRYGPEVPEVWEAWVRQWWTVLRLCLKDPEDHPEQRRKIKEAQSSRREGGLTMSHAAFAIIVDDFLGVDPLVLRDLGPWDQRPTITNDAEQVVRTLVALGRLTDGR